MEAQKLYKFEDITKAINNGFMFVFEDGVEFELSKEQFDEIRKKCEAIAGKILTEWEPIPVSIRVATLNIVDESWSKEPQIFEGSDVPIIVEDKKDG